MVVGGQNPSKEDEMDELHGKDEMGRWSGDMIEEMKK